MCCAQEQVLEEQDRVRRAEAKVKQQQQKAKDKHAAALTKIAETGSKRRNVQSPKPPETATPAPQLPQLIRTKLQPSTPVVTHIAPDFSPVNIMNDTAGHATLPEAAVTALKEPSIAAQIQSRAATPSAAHVQKLFELGRKGSRSSLASPAPSAPILEGTQSNSGQATAADGLRVDPEQQCAAVPSEEETSALKSAGQEAATAKLGRQASVTPLLQGNRPALGAAFKRGGIRSSTASPVAGQAANVQLRSAKSPSPMLDERAGRDSAAYAPSSSPVLSQIMGKTSVPGIRTGTVSPCVQDNLQTALMHVLQRLSPEYPVSE